MATGQSSFSFTAYGEVSTYDGKNGGFQLVGNGYANPSYQSLPVAGTRVIGISPGQVYGTAFGSVTANSIVEIIPPALQPLGFTKKYLCDSTEAQLAALRT
jgi:hypothetical protein